MRYFTIIVIMLTVIISASAHDYKVSESGYDFIKGYEKCSLTKYKDSHGYSIGWGHLIKSGELYHKISQKQADKLFVNDISIVNSAINRLLKPMKRAKFSQRFIDGLGDLIYNCGEGGVKKSEFYKRLLRCRIDKNGNINQNDFNFTIAAVKTTHVYCAGHKDRRYKCHLMMMK